MSKDKLSAAEQCKEMLRAQLVVLTDELNESNAKTEKYLDIIKEFTNKEKQSENEKKDLNEKLQNIKAEFHSKLEESTGSYYALKLAHVHLETKLKTTEQSKTKLEKDLDVSKHSISSLQNENEELKERIKAGAKEYSKLFEKYRLLKNQQFNYDMNIYHDLNGNIHLKRDLNQNRLVFDQNQQRNANYRHSTPTEDHDGDIDSAITDKTVSQSARASSTDIENTLLDALLGSSFPWNDSQLNKHALNMQQHLCKMGMSTSASSNDVTAKGASSAITTTVQPKMAISKSQNQTSDLSDDGLVHLDEMNSQKLQNINFNAQASSKLNSNNKHTSARYDNDDEDVFADTRANVINRIMDNKKISNTQNTSQTQMDVRACDICNYIFPTDSDINEIENHYTIHYGPSCPICFLVFRKGYPQTDFENHVNSHFPTN